MQLNFLLAHEKYLFFKTISCVFLTSIVARRFSLIPHFIMLEFSHFLFITFMFIILFNQNTLTAAQNMTEVDQIRTEIIEIELFLLDKIEKHTADKRTLATYVFNWHKQLYKQYWRLQTGIHGNFSELMSNNDFIILRYNMQLFTNAYYKFAKILDQNTSSPDFENRVLSYAENILNNQIFDIQSFFVNDSFLWKQNSNVYDVALEVSF